MSMYVYQYYNGQNAYFLTDNGNILEVMQENCPQSPREWDNLGTLSLTTNYFELVEGNLSGFGDFLSHYKVKQSGYDKEALLRDIDSICESAKKRGDICLPVSVYDHGGLSFYIGKPTAKWDNYLAGFIYVEAARIREEYGVKRISSKLRDKVENVLAGEIKDLDDFENGNVWGYTLYNKDGDMIDSCFGFIGDSALEDIEDTCGEKIKKFLGNFNNVEECLENVEL